MQKNAFIFSGRLQYRLLRHIVFWLVCFTGQSLAGVGGPAFFGVLTHNMLVEYTLVPALYLPGQFFLVYMLLYFVVPNYILKTRYYQALAWIVLLTIISAAISTLIYAPLIDPVRTHFMTFAGGIRFQAENWVANLPAGFIFSLRAVVTVAGFAVAIKLMKYWYEKEYVNSILQKEKLDAELQSLKAQLHPHFLFNTLNNIYSITENTSPIASEMLIKLSHLLRYILYECNKPVIKLSQEFKIIEDYAALEIARYKNIEADIRLAEGAGHYTIAPLLLLPLVENCFKHGTSKMIDHPWMNISAVVKNDLLNVKVINGKPGGRNGNFMEGIGLANLKKRLQLLYPAKHQLEVICDEDVFIVQLNIHLTAA
ncbi:MAG TPA: histidine kinase [Chitinophagaceae bacterium]|nr:histidine kinase [Chitinophagaceae bacterium]